MSSFAYIAACLGAFFGLIIVGRLLIALHDASVVRREVFETPWLTLSIDETAKELVATQDNQGEVIRMKLGSITWHVSGNQLRLTTFRMPQALGAEKLSEYDQTLVVRTVQLYMGGSNPDLVNRWLSRRESRLVPDRVGHVAKLNAQIKDAAEIARRHLPEKPVIECDTGRFVEQYAYVAFLPSGHVYGMQGIDALPTPVIRVFAGPARHVRVLFASGREGTFELTPAETRILQGLQQKGVLHLPPLASRGY